MKTILFAVLAGFTIGLVPILSRSGMKNTDPLIGSLIFSLSTSILLLIALFSTGKWRVFLPFNPEIKFLILGGAAIALFTYSLLSAYKYGEVRLVAPIQISLGLVFSILLATLLLGEHVGFLKATGIVVIMGGIILTVLG